MTITRFLYLDHPSRLRLAVLVLPLASGIVLALVGAFGTYLGMGLPVRILHFTTGGLLIGGLSVVVTALVRRFFFAGAPLPLRAAIAIAFAMAPPGAAIVYLLLRVLAPHVLPYVGFGELTAQVLTINLLIGAMTWVLQRAPAVAEVDDHQADTAAPVAADAIAEAPDSLRSRLPPPLRGAAILSMSAEDHYVRVRTDRGQTLILMNLSAAVAALGSESGIRIHRSHWVARQVALRDARGGRAGIRVEPDTELPVSRAGRKLLRELDAVG